MQPYRAIKITTSEIFWRKFMVHSPVDTLSRFWMLRDKFDGNAERKLPVLLYVVTVAKPHEVLCEQYCSSCTA